MGLITCDDFDRVEIRTGTIVALEDFPQAKKPAYRITADFGESAGLKKTSARVTELYTKEDLLGRQIIGVLNFPVKQIGPFMSEFLLTGFYDENGNVVLAVPERAIRNGAALG